MAGKNKTKTAGKKGKAEAAAGKKIFVSRPVFDKEMAKATVSALQNEKMVMGDSVYKFEEAFAKYCGVTHCVTTSSGTFALQFTMMALGIKSKEQEVLTTPASFIATSNSVLHAGATPTFSDIAEADLCLDPSRIPAALTPSTKAVLPVHLYGMPADMDPILDAAAKAGILVIEDACQAHGSVYKGRKCGSLGLAAAFSFYSTKNLTVGGDGGAVTTSDDKLAKAVEKLRDCGRKSQYEHDTLGYTSRLNTVNAAIGLVQLRNLDKWNRAKRKLAAIYRRKLGKVADKLALPMQERPSENTFGNYHLYAARTAERDKLKGFLAEGGIFCGTNYPIPIHLQPLYKDLFPGRYPEGSFPRAERLSKDVICLPMYAELSSKDVSRISDKILEFFRK